MEQLVTQGGPSRVQANSMQAAVPIATCTNCFKPLRQGAKSRYCKECRAKLRLRLMFEAATKQTQEPQHPGQPLMLTACGACGATVQLPPHPIDPRQVIICIRCHNATFSRPQRRQSGQRRVAPVPPTLPAPSTPHTPQQVTPEQAEGQPQNLAELDDMSFARFIASEAMQCVHPAHATADLCGLAAEFVRIAPEGRMLAPASMLPVPYRPSVDGRLYNERGDVQVPVIPWKVPMPIPLPPPPSAIPNAHVLYMQHVAPPTPVPKLNLLPTQEATVPIRSRPPPVRPPPQHRGSLGSNTPIPKIRRTLPASSVLPSHLIQQQPPQPPMLQHFHAAVPPPPVQRGADMQVQGWAERGGLQAVGKVRLCETSGCNRVLSPTHPWRICNHCLAAADSKHNRVNTSGATDTKTKVQSLDVSVSATPSTASSSHQHSKPRLQIATEPSHQPAVKTEAHHVLPLPASAQTSPSEQAGPPPIARSRRSASADIPSPVVPGPQSQPPITIPSLFPQLAVQAKIARAKNWQAVATASSLPTEMYPARNAPPNEEALLQQMDTAAMLKHVESLVREHVGVASAAEVPDTKQGMPPQQTSRVQQSVERMRGGLSSSPIATFVGTGQTPKLETKRVPLPLPRRARRGAGTPKVEPVQTITGGGSKVEPIVLDDDGDVRMQSEDTQDASLRSGDHESGKGSVESSDVGRGSAASAMDSKESDMPSETISKDGVSAQGTTHVPTLNGSGRHDTKVKTEEIGDQLVIPPPKQDTGSHAYDETLPGDTSEEEEPLSAVVKAKQANKVKDEERPMIRINVKHHRSSSNLVAETTSSSSPLRIRIPSIRKYSPPRITVPSFPLQPSSPSASSSPSSPNPPTSTADTPWDSDLSDLTPIEDPTDEGESEIDEAEPADAIGEARPKLKIKLKIPKSLSGETPEERRSRLRPPKEAKPSSTCRIRRCQNLLGPGYRWKLCDICREYNRRAQRRAKLQQEANDPEARSKRALVDLSAYPTGSRICTGRWCKTVIPPEGEYKWRMCKRCRQAQRQQDKYAAIFDVPALPRGKKRTRGDPETDFLELQYPEDENSDDFPYVDRTPSAYQCLDELIQEMEGRYRSFFTAQLHYLQFKASKGIDISRTMPSHFGFEGEYSVIADPAGGTVDFVVKSVATQLQGVLGLQFIPSGVVMGPEASVISKFQCQRDEHIPLLSDSSKSNPPGQILIRSLQGSLNIIVAWDRRHKYFPGQRIQIQFHLRS